MPKRKDTNDTTPNSDDSRLQSAPVSNLTARVSFFDFVIHVLGGYKSEETLLFEIEGFSQKLTNFRTNLYDSCTSQVATRSAVLRGIQFTVSLIFRHDNLGLEIKSGPHADETDWSADTCATVRLKSYVADVADLVEVRESSEVISDCYIFFDMRKAKYSLINSGEGQIAYAKNDVLMVEVKLWVGLPRGVTSYRPITYDFTSPCVGMSNAKIMVDGRIFHINKDYLALTSKYFAILFYSGFCDKEQKNLIELKEIKPEEFDCFLKALYPNGIKVTTQNLEVLLRMSSRFEASVILEKCEELMLHILKLAKEEMDKVDLDFLDSADDICLDRICMPYGYSKYHVYELLLFADKYNLKKVVDYCLKCSLFNERRVKNLLKSRVYHELSRGLKIKLCDLMSDYC